MSQAINKTTFLSKIPQSKKPFSGWVSQVSFDSKVGVLGDLPIFCRFLEKNRLVKYTADHTST